MVGNKRKNDASSHGFAIIIVVILISVILIFAGGFALISIIESRATNSQTQSIKAYYNAESGIQEAIWKIQNNSEWRENFANDPEWEETIERTNLFSEGGSYTVQISNSDLNEANLSSLGKQIIRSDTFARRMVGTMIYQTGDASEEAEDPEIGGGDGGNEESVKIPNMDGTVLAVDNGLNFSGVVADITGNIYSDSDINVRLWSDVDVSRNVRAIGDVNVDVNSSVSSAGISARNYPPVPDVLESPYVGFDDPNDSLSIKARATVLNQVYTAEEFNFLLEQTPNFSKDGAVYVTGAVSVERGENLSINGALAADGAITIGNIWQWWDPCVANDAQVTINHVAGSPAGIFSKGRIIINTCVGDIYINGVIYAGESFNMTSIENNFTLEGGVVAQEIQWTGIWDGISLTFNENAMNDTLRTGGRFAPLISFDHWEEEY